MPYYEGWLEATQLAFQQVWSQTVMFVPRIIGVGLLFVVGLIVAGVLSGLVMRALRAIKIDEAVNQTGIDKEFEKAGVSLSISRFLARLTYWLVLIFTIVLATDSLFGQGTVTTLLQPLFEFIPNVAFAVIILLGSVLLANFLRGMIQAAVVGAKLHAPKLLGSIAWWATVIFGFVTALRQLNIGDFIVNIAFYAIVATFFGLALAFGLAFGLGGRDRAADMMAKWKGMFDR